MMKVFSLITRLRGLTSRPFVRNVATVVLGAAASQAITMMFAPIVARLYGPEVFGLQGIFISVLGLFTSISSLGYPVAIVLQKSDEDALKIIRLSVCVCMVISAIVALIIKLYGDNLLSLLNARGISEFLYFLPAAMIFYVFNETLNQWLIRKNSFVFGAKYTAISAFVINSLKTIAGTLLPSAIVLIAINTFGQLLSFLLTLWGWQRFGKKIQIDTGKSEKKKTIWQLAKIHADFPLLRTPQNLINAISQGLPVMLLSGLFGLESSGQYTLALTVLGVPSALIANSVMAAFYPKITGLINSDANPREHIVKATIGMAAVGFIPLLLILAAGPTLFEFVFGHQWRTSGIYAQLLAIWLFLQFINKPAVASIPALKLQGGLLIYELFSTGSKVLALWLGFVLFKNDIVAIGLFSLFGSLAYVWLIHWVIRNSSNNDFKKQMV